VFVALHLHFVNVVNAHQNEWPLAFCTSLSPTTLEINESLMFSSDLYTQVVPNVPDFIC